MPSIIRQVKDHAARLFPRLEQSRSGSESTCGSSVHDWIAHQGLQEAVRTCVDTGHTAGLPTSDIIPPTNRSHLPSELLVQVLQLAEPLCIVRCRLVCKRFQQIIDGTPELQYMIELYVSNYQNNEDNILTGTRDRLAALRTCRNWWKSPDNHSWSRKDTTPPVPLFSWQPYQFYDNLWLVGDRDPSLLDLNEHEERGSEVNAIRCFCFEDALDGSPVVDSWTLSFPFFFDTYVAHPSKGILYLLRLMISPTRRDYRVRTVSLADGSILADQNFEGETEVDDSQWALDFRPYCIDNLLVLRIWTNDRSPFTSDSLTCVTILDVKSTKVVATHCKATPATTEVVLQVLTKDVYLLHFTNNDILFTEIYKLVSSPSSSNFTSHHIATFRYPKIRNEVAAYWNYIIAPLHLQGSKFSRNEPVPLFLHAEETPLVVIHRRSPGATISHYIPSSVFIFVAKQLVPSNRRCDAVLDVPWKSWGPANSRCFYSAGPILTGYCVGNQVLLQDLTVLDFNAKDISRDLQHAGIEYRKLGRGCPAGIKASSGYFRRIFRKIRPTQQIPQDSDDTIIPGTTARIVTSPTVIQKRLMFDEDIETMLPYREWRPVCEGLNGIIWHWGGTWMVCAQGGALVYCTLDRPRAASQS